LALAHLTDLGDAVAVSGGELLQMVRVALEPEGHDH